MTRTVVALFDDMQTAQSAVQEMVNNGFRRDDISLVVTDREGGYKTTAAGQVEESAGGAAAGAGAGIGGILGGIAGLLVGLGALAIPGVGPILAAGPIAAALAGAGVGAAAGGLLGALVDAGVPEDQASYYAEGIRRGGILVTVRSDDDMYSRATGILNRHHPVNVNDRAAEWRHAGWTGYDPDTGLDEDRGDNLAPGATAGAETTADYYQKRGGISGGVVGGDSSEMTGPGAEAAGGAMLGDSQHARIGMGSLGDEGATVEHTVDDRDYSRFGHTADDPQGTTRRTDSEEHASSGSYGNRPGLDYTGAAGGTMGDSGVANLSNAGQRLGQEERPKDFQSGQEGKGAWVGGLSGGTGYDNVRGQELGHGGMGAGQQGPDVSPETGQRFGDTGPAGGESTGSARESSHSAQYGGGPSGEVDPGKTRTSPSDAPDERRFGGSSHTPDQGSSGSGAGSLHTNQAGNREAPTFGSGMGGGQGAQGDLTTGHREGGMQDASQRGEMGGGSHIYDQEWQGHFRQNYGSGGSDYPRYQPAYQYGYDLANDSRFRGRQWSDVEQSARSDWERLHPNDPWQDVKEAIRHAWDKVRDRKDQAG